MAEYITLTPVGDHRTKHLHDFIEALKNLTPPPGDIVLCFDLDTEVDTSQYNGITIKYSPEIGYPKGSLKRICTSREILRKHFIYNNINYPVALWVDSDIIVPPNTYSELIKVLKRDTLMTVVNKYKGRGDPASMWCGSGVMLTSKCACTASRFWVGNIYDENGTEKHLSEDFVFFAIMDQGKHFSKQWAGLSGRSCKEYVKVEHRTEGRIR